MAQGKKSFVLYSDYQEIFQELSDEIAGKLIKHIFKYVNDENPEATEEIIKLLFIPIKQQLKRDLKNWESIREKRSAAGKASAEKRKQKSTKSTSVKSVEQTSTNSTVNVNVNVNDNVIYSFSDFWNDYDKKVGDKSKVQKKFEALSNKNKELIKEHIPKYKKSQPNKKYRKDPSTYLNNKSWNDEIIIDESDVINYNNPTLINPYKRS
jgi:hypothetical protein